MNLDDLPRALARLELFTGFRAGNIDFLIEHSTVTRHERDEHIVFPGDQSSDVYIILDGIVRITFYAESGRDIIFRDMRPGEPVGVLAAIDDMPRSAYCVARQSVALLKFNKTTLIELIEREPTFGVNLLKHSSGIIRHLTQRLVDFATEKASNRIRLELLRMARQNMEDERWGVIIDAPTHAELASRVGSHREAVTREMGDLSKRGVVRRQSGKRLSVDTVGMEQLIKENMDGR